MIPRKGSNDKLQEVFDLLGFSADERHAAETFFNKEAGQEALDLIAFRDLSAAAPDPVNKLAKELVRKKRVEELARLFLLVFARGGATCYQMFTLDEMRMISKVPEMDAVKLTAAFGEAVGAYPYLNCSLWGLFDVAKHSTKTVRRALEYLGNKGSNGEFILLALYFRVEYQNRKPFLKAEQEGAQKWLGKGPNGAPRICTEIEEEDMPLLSAYEKLAIKNFAHLYFGCVSQTVTEAALQELADDVADGRMPQKLSPLIGTAVSVNENLRSLTVGLSYWNYMLSEKLKNILKFCIALDWKGTLDTMSTMSSGISISVEKNGGAYDEEFGIDTENYLRWAVGRNFTEIMKSQFERHRECYLGLMKQMDVEQGGKMLSVIRQQDADLYEKIMKEKRLHAKKGNNQDREKLIDSIVPAGADMNTAKAYLRGESAVETLYPFAGSWKQSLSYAGGREWRQLADYMKIYKDGEFFRRCEAYMLFKQAMYFFRNQILEPGSGREKIAPDRVEKIFADFSAEKVALSYQLSGVFMIYDRLYVKKLQDSFLDVALQVFTGYLKERREEMLAAFAAADAFGRCFALRVMRQDAQENKKEILAYAQDSAKIVKQELFDILLAQRDWETEIKALVMAKKAAEKELGIKVLAAWQETWGDFREFFAQAFEKEKNAKIKELLVNSLGNGTDGEERTAAATPEFSRENLVKELHRGGKKRGLAWAYETPFSVVHMAEDTKAQGAGRAAAEEEYLQAILLAYSSMDVCGVSANAAFLAKSVDAAEFAVYVNELFGKWMAAGAEAKKRWVLYAAAIHGGSAIIERLQTQIKEWPAQARGAIACEAVRALSLNPLPQALLVVDGIARKFKFKQVRAAAGEALAFAAGQLGITREELADRIVPDFGFDENVERVFDYGARKFIVTLTTALEVEVYEAAGGETAVAEKGSSVPEKKKECAIVRGKKLKNLPAPGKKDDAAKAAAAYEEFKQLKKQMKTTVSGQKQRLEMALSTAREWSIAAWRQLFVKNPIMHRFAISLIWGIYENGKLTQSFRYMEDGSFNTKDEEEFVLPDEREAVASGELVAGKGLSTGVRIGLVHPVELTAEDRAAWKEQLEDYEIVQPFEQLDRAVYTMTKEEADTQELTRFWDEEVNDLALGGKLLGFGWYRGSVQDAGCFDTYYREDKEAGLGVELHFSGSYVGGGNEDVTLYGVRFYKADTVARDSYVYDEADKQKAYFLRDIPARYFSEIVWQLTKVVMK